jgi:UDP:flavonoid glycosyltransferase YjiC (YdhE family)
VVHHGGAGTTAAALRAGVPSVVVPFHGDQPFWGRLVHARGVGTRPIPRQRLTASRLAAAIEEALTDAPLRARAAHTGERVRQEDGVAAAVALIGRLGR